MDGVDRADPDANFPLSIVISFVADAPKTTKVVGQTPTLIGADASWALELRRIVAGLE